MRIGIIGAGPLGSSLARKLRNHGHSVKLANSRGPDSLASLAAEVGATAASVFDAVKDVDVVIVSIPMKGFAALPAGLFDNVPEDVVIVDTANYYPKRDGLIEALERGMVESHWVSTQLERPVVKAFNSIAHPHIVTMAKVSGAAERIAVPVAGDDARSKALVLALVDQVGFDGFDAGGIEDSWRQQPGTPAYCTDYDSAGVRKALAGADRGRAARDRDIAWDKLAQAPAGMDASAIGRLIQSVCRALHD